ncbi:MAG: hydrogenase maturation protease [Bacteroidota bacterium]
MPEQKNRILFLGMGNEVLRDDGIGPKVVNHLKEIFDDDHFEFMTSLLGGMETIEIMKDFDEVVIIDGIFTEDGVPGTVYFMTYPDNKSTLHLSNAHDISFDMAVKLAHALSIPVPQRIRIIAVEIVEDREFGEELTIPLQRRYDEIISLIAAMVQMDYTDKKPVDYEKI